MTFIEDVISTENRLKHLKWVPCTHRPLDSIADVGAADDARGRLDRWKGTWSAIDLARPLRCCRWIAYGLLAFTAIFMAATFGLTYMVADMHKDSVAVVCPRALVPVPGCYPHRPL